MHNEILQKFVYAPCSFFGQTGLVSSWVLSISSWKKICGPQNAITFWANIENFEKVTLFSNAEFNGEYFQLLFLACFSM